MKIAAVTDDGQTISAHFGRAHHYLVITVEVGQVIAREQRDKARHHHFHGEHDHQHEHRHEHPEGHGFDAGAQDRHTRMIAAITDCDVVLARVMGAGMYARLQEAGISPILTTANDIDKAITDYLAGRLEDHPERLH